MADCNNTDYQMIDFSTITDIENAQIVKAEINSIDENNNCADITLINECIELSGVDLSEVEFFYHCQYSTGTVEDLAKGWRAFAVADEVLVIYIPANGEVLERLYIIGHTDLRGTQQCRYGDFLYLYAGTCVSIFDVSNGCVLDLSTWYNIDDESPNAPDTLPCIKDSAFDSWFAYNFIASVAAVDVESVVVSNLTSTDYLGNYLYQTTPWTVDYTWPGTIIEDTCSGVFLNCYQQSKQYNYNSTCNEVTIIFDFYSVWANDGDDRSGYRHYIDAAITTPVEAEITLPYTYYGNYYRFYDTESAANVRLSIAIDTDVNNTFNVVDDGDTSHTFTHSVTISGRLAIDDEDIEDIISYGPVTLSGTVDPDTSELSSTGRIMVVSQLYDTPPPLWPFRITTGELGYYTASGVGESYSQVYGENLELGGCDPYFANPSVLNNSDAVGLTPPSGSGYTVDRGVILFDDDSDLVGYCFPTPTITMFDEVFGETLPETEQSVRTMILAKNQIKTALLRTAIIELFTFYSNQGYSEATIRNTYRGGLFNFDSYRKKSDV